MTNVNGVAATAHPTDSKRMVQSAETPPSPTMRLELQDGGVFEGTSFGADCSRAGELVFQTGMVGYPEAITDPSYRGQILVITFPEVGNYGVPARDATDALVDGLSAHFEAAEIHVAGLVVASYSGEQYSHHLATSSLGAWLREQGVPAIYGVDTRALTKMIRHKGSMLGRLLLPQTATADWYDPNVRNLVADGKSTRVSLHDCRCVYIVMTFCIECNVRDVNVLENTSA